MNASRPELAIHTYTQAVTRRFKSGLAREHAYRGDLQALIEAIAPEILATNEPPRIECGAPDFILTKGGIPVGYIEAKDLDVDLDGREQAEQLNRYRRSLPNLVFTNFGEERLECFSRLDCLQRTRAALVGQSMEWGG